MTLGEFKAWLDGYLSAGGNDLTVIKGKLDETQDAAPYVLSPRLPGYPNLEWQHSPGTGSPYYTSHFSTCGEGVNNTAAVS